MGSGSSKNNKQKQSVKVKIPKFQVADLRAPVAYPQMPIPSAPPLDTEQDELLRNASPQKEPTIPRSQQIPQPKNSNENEDPDILFDENPEVQEIQGNQPTDLSSVPQFSSQSCTLQGKWSYHMELSEIYFPESISNYIEKDFILGNIRSKFEFSGSQAEIIFQESLMTLNGISGEKLIYPISRSSSNKEKYWWYANDQSARPIIKEIEEILNSTEWIFIYSLDGVVYQINLHKKSMIEMKTGLVRNLVIA
ncbi:unnamed protein product [Blepharisma stoltei]|uniref:Uncharacterized protein n=1 Tax=Blepharisma stoltei TaxID=1481888 RepID=A0AAU9IS60_9CILI|nr:unnamed protein product [Blepharisma stoltei]